MTPKQTVIPIPLLIWGASGHARVVADIVRLVGEYEIAGFIDSVNPDRQGAEFCGAQILGGQEALERLRSSGIRHIILGFGDCQARLALSTVVEKLDFELSSAIHPGAIVAGNTAIGRGTVVMAGAVINPGSTIGTNVIINTASSIDHDCLIADGAHVGPGAHLGGGVTIGQGSWVGIGAIIKDKIAIGSGTIIGAGAVVLHNIPDRVVAFGVPARIHRGVEA